MKKGSVFGILILSACGVLLIWCLSAIIRLTVIKYWGKKVTVSVVEVPLRCGKYNRLKILHERKISEVNIPRESCRNKKYREGQKITLLKHPAYDDFVWPHSNPEIVIVIVIALLAFAYFSTRQKTPIHAHAASHKRKPET